MPIGSSKQQTRSTVRIRASGIRYLTLEPGFEPMGVDRTHFTIRIWVLSRWPERRSRSGPNSCRQEETEHVRSWVPTAGGVCPYAVEAVTSNNSCDSHRSVQEELMNHLLSSLSRKLQSIEIEILLVQFPGQAPGVLAIQGR